MERQVQQNCIHIFHLELELSFIISPKDIILKIIFLAINLQCSHVHKFVDKLKIFVKPCHATVMWEIFKIILGSQWVNLMVMILNIISVYFYVKKKYIYIHIYRLSQITFQSFVYSTSNCMKLLNCLFKYWFCLRKDIEDALFSSPILFMQALRKGI